MDDWPRHAACRGLPASIFYGPCRHPERAAGVCMECGDTTGRLAFWSLTDARAICATCPVRAECLGAGMDEEWGVWGGIGPKLRKRLRARQTHPYDETCTCGYCGEVTRYWDEMG